MEILFDGSADPIPNHLIAKHRLSTILGFLGAIQIAFGYVGGVLARRFYGFKFNAFDEVSRAHGEFQKQLGL